MADNAAIATAEGNVLISLRASRTDGSMSVRIHHKMGRRNGFVFVPIATPVHRTPGDRDRLLDDVSSLLHGGGEQTENKEERMLGLRVVARFLLSIIRGEGVRGFFFLLRRIKCLVGSMIDRFVSSYAFTAGEWIMNNLISVF